MDGHRTETGTLSESLAAFATGLRYEDIPAPVIDRALIHILDALGIAVASRTFAFTGPTLTAVAALSGGGSGTIIGSTAGAAPRDAAMANGVLIHGLDYDDTHLQAIVHATVAVLPAVMATAEHCGASGAETLTAFCIGMEAAVRMGAAVKGGFHHTGFHATGVLAHFSSALAAGRLTGASETDHINALGIAGSTASGIQVFLEDGAWTKRLHPGWAAAGGMTAATLARAGFRGPKRALEGRFGLFETHLHGWAKDVDASYLTDGLGETWMMQDTALKPYPVCHFIHGATDAALDLRDEIAGAGIEAVDILLPADTLKIVAEPIEGKRHAGTEYEAKFSAPFVIASALLKGRFGLADLSDEALSDPATRALAAKCSCAADPDSLYPDYFSGGVKVHLADGRTLSRHVPVNSGAGSRQLTLDEATRKFLQNTGLALDDTQAMAIRAAVLDLASGGIAPLMRALQA
ncbi:MmgE/PrpD family protein [Chachezhania antarctica]|uniref:MmgE/PrpD family protein n=1 Tax=Chachezhania antarctica TaxID=2340860 RepID=UPI000EB3806B|nr:MmgE/PrpD family protein [Chachezhania antarctica]|tara:strand:+ start:1583 stop:2974 length:1392 start_codon:yes stop_codon:yes gene_type:complete